MSVPSHNSPSPFPLLARAPVIPVVVIERLEDAVPLARALVEGGLPLIEVTLRTPVALEAIRAIAAEVDGAILGAGTVTETAHVEAALEAGAAYLVSPGTTPAFAQALAHAPVPVLPGCATVSEAMALAALGFQALKFFPAEAAGRRPVPEIHRRPTAGPALLPHGRHRPGQCGELSGPAQCGGSGRLLGGARRRHPRRRLRQGPRPRHGRLPPQARGDVRLRPEAGRRLAVRGRDHPGSRHKDGGQFLMAMI